jgi:hypothetical protein
LKSESDQSHHIANIETRKPKETSEIRREKADRTALQLIPDAMTMNPSELVLKRPRDRSLRRSAIETLMINGQQAGQNVYGGKLTDKNVWVWGDNQAILQTTYKQFCNTWWDGFQCGQVELVIIDDWPWESLAYHIRIWGDRYPFIAQVNNSGIVLAPGDFKLIITSNFTIEQEPLPSQLNSQTHSQTFVYSSSFPEVTYFRSSI